MSLPSGTKLGPYEIIAPLGAGGMGEVYRAQDTRLGRAVAIKVLLGSVAAEPDRLRRFEQEARTLAALNHVNILAVLDIGQSESGTPYLVSEFLEGETLREKLAPGPLPVRKAIEYALGIARGLAAGHSKGIIHRDLKPENVLLIRDGGVKILDYGLAKLAQPGSANNSETLLSEGTTPGVVLGTVGYMSPEQVRGEPAEATSDIFSFGAVLYEMLSGKRAFKRDTAAETMTAVLRENPPELSESGWHGPLGLQRIVERCLEKDPRQRFQSALDLAFAIEALSGAATSSNNHTRIDELPAQRKRAPWIIPVTALVLLALGGGAVWLGMRLAQKPVPRYRQLTFQRGFIGDARFTKDGQTLLYDGQFGNNPKQIFSIRMEQLRPVKIDLPSAMLYSVSGSEQMAIGLDPGMLGQGMIGTLAEAPIGGGTPRPLQKSVVSADYAPDGTAMAVSRINEGKSQLEYPAGKTIFSSVGYVDYVRVSPDGKSVAFAEHTIAGDDRGYVSVIDVQGKYRRLTVEFRLLEGIAWDGDGKRIWYTGAGGDSASIDLYTVDMEGKSERKMPMSHVAILEDIARDGRMVLSVRSDNLATTAVDASGKQTANLGLFSKSILFDISPDGKAVVLNEVSQPSGSYYQAIYQKADGSPPIVLGPGAVPKLSPDGQTVAAIIYKSPIEIAFYPVGTGESRTLQLNGLVSALQSHWFPDGKHILLMGARKDEPMRTFVVDVNSGKMETIGPENFKGVLVSKDGQRIVGFSPDGCVMFDRRTNKVAPILGIASSGAMVAHGEDEVQRFTADGQGLLVVTKTAGLSQASAFRVDLATGNRTLLKTVDLPDKAGVVGLLMEIAEDEKSYAYDVITSNSTLYELSGVK
jgi:eukaryotic-like serine/threonine-protein kinase